MIFLVNKLIILICLISSIARFAIDSYLPSLPAIANSLSASNMHVQLTISLYLLGFSISQLIYGPLSDHYGRKKIIIIGLGIFIFGNIICTFANSIHLLIIARLIAGAGAGASAVLNRAIANDKFKGADFAKVWSYTTTTLTVTLILAPLIGGLLQDFIGWRANLAFMTFYVIIILLILLNYLPETNVIIHSDNKYNLKFNKIMRNYYRILKDKKFVAYVFCYTFTFAGLIAYFQISPFLFINRLGYTATEYGLLSLFIAVSYFFGGLIVQKYVHRLGITPMLMLGIIIMMLGGLLMLIGYLCNIINIFMVLSPAIIYVIGARMVIPTSMAGSLHDYTKETGCAAALVGFIQMIGTAIVSYVLAQLEHETQLALGIALIALTICAFSSVLVIKLPIYKG